MFKSTLVALCVAMPLGVVAAEPLAADATKKQRNDLQTHVGQQRGADMARCRKAAEDDGLKGVEYRAAVGRCLANASTAPAH
jgi:hypothetical protein